MWSGVLQHIEKYQSEAFFISPPDEQQTAEKLAYSSLWLQSIFSPWTAGSQDRSACKSTAVLNPTQGNLPTCIPSIAGKLFPWSLSPLSYFFPGGKWQRCKLFGRCHISFQRWWSLGWIKYSSVLFSLGKVIQTASFQSGLLFTITSRNTFQFLFPTLWCHLFSLYTLAMKTDETSKELHNKNIWINLILVSAVWLICSVILDKSVNLRIFFLPWDMRMLSSSHRLPGELLLAMLEVQESFPTQM